VTIRVSRVEPAAFDLLEARAIRPELRWFS
jgi:hypothetical protein